MINIFLVLKPFQKFTFFHTFQIFIFIYIYYNLVMIQRSYRTLLINLTRGFCKDSNRKPPTEEA